MVQLLRDRLIAVAVILAVALGVAGTARASAQDATPMAGMLGIPNHIHDGTCDALGDVVAPLADAQLTGMMGMMEGSDMASPMADMASPMAGMEGMGGPPIPVAVATTEVELALSDILAAPHAINAHDPADPSDPARYLACGNIAGTPDDQGNLFVGLGETNDSGVTGVAWLLDDGAGGTTVTVFLAYHGPMMDDMGMMEEDAMATPAG